MNRREPWRWWRFALARGMNRRKPRRWWRWGDRIPHSLGQFLGAIAGMTFILACAWRTAHWWASNYASSTTAAEYAQVAQLLVAVLTLGPIFWAVLKYRQVAADERKAKHYQAWQAISDSQGKPGSGGRKAALEDLHCDGQPLVGVDLSGGAYLLFLELRDADLSGANLAGADLRYADLREACLEGADLSGAILTGADLRYANLRGADLAGAILHSARLGGARLTTEQLLSAKDWRLADLPAHLKHLELQQGKFRTSALDLLRRQYGSKKPQEPPAAAPPPDAPPPGRRPGAPR